MFLLETAKTSFERFPNDVSLQIDQHRFRPEERGRHGKEHQGTWVPLPPLLLGWLLSGWLLTWIPMGHPMGRPMGRSMGILMGRPMRRPMGGSMGRPMGIPIPWGAL